MATGGIARLACAFAEDKGIDVEPILRSSRLSRKQISHPQIRLEVRNQIKFLALVAETVGDDFLGFHLSQDYDLREMGFLYYVTASADTLGDALLRCARYSSVVNEGLRLTLRKTSKHIGVGFEYEGVPRRFEQHQIEFLVGTVMRACRQITNRNLTAERVSFSHWRKTAPELKKFFGCDIRFGADADVVMFPSPIQDIVVASRDPYLNSLLIQYYEEALARRKAHQSALSVNVENAISVLMPHGKARMSEVARELGISPRTLARRLSSEGLTFASMLQTLRYDLAKRHLADEDLSISKIAWLLGYQDISSFTNAFKRWTGKPPAAVRKGLQ
ncbi:MAG TPA: AraC family transcriptional regulator ligand-binding domain-containing protein [Xanthobacteraceae bacterium]|nr:AraC family transcriptional regulator ligand-binding domain-containing protein [Xanthobacteraceae bacterium]